jgi:outer membrane protein
MKKVLLLSLFFCFGLSITAEAQMLTRFAVVDLPKVYVAFFSESRAVRNFEDQSARVQAEIDRMTAEIQNLRAQQVTLQVQGNHDQAFRLEADINRRTEFLREYHRTMTAQLESMRNSLTQGGGFLEQVYDEIRFIAESEGFSMVLNMTENTGILWFSPTVDITDRLIRNLQENSRRH